jgi:hypothetical protein
MVAAAYVISARRHAPGPGFVGHDVDANIRSKAATARAAAATAALDARIAAAVAEAPPLPADLYARLRLLITLSTSERNDP